MTNAKRGRKTASKRQLRVGEELRHIISGILTRDLIHDPDVAGASITITQVQTSPDMRNATVFVTPLGGENEENVIAGLNRTSGVIQSEMGRQLTMKFTPKLVFKKDDSFEYASHIDELLRKNKQSDIQD